MLVEQFAPITLAIEPLAEGDCAPTHRTDRAAALGAERELYDLVRSPLEPFLAGTRMETHPREHSPGFRRRLFQACGRART